ncbi:MAG: hypothetical protein QW430_12700 [Metallosphaera sp.]|uniref:hypothetical protein n=1 Tax=Metallosphaera sp. TaxID=2020860 RepID=UPI0031619E5A
MRVKMSEPLTQPPTPAQNAGAKIEEIDEEKLERRDNIRWLARLAAKEEQISNMISSAVYSVKNEILRKAIEIADKTFKEEVVKFAKEIAENEKDLTKIRLNAIEIYAGLKAVDTIVNKLLEKYTYRYSDDLVDEDNVIAEMREKTQSIVTYFLEKYLLYDGVLDDGKQLLEKIIDNLYYYYTISEIKPGLEKDIKMIREQIESDHDIVKATYAILNDMLDLMRDNYDDGLSEGYEAYEELERNYVGRYQVCKVYNQNIVLCSPYGVYLANNIHFRRIVKHAIEAYAHFKTIEALYKIMKEALQEFNINTGEFEKRLAELISKTTSIIEEIMNYK